MSLRAPESQEPVLTPSFRTQNLYDPVNTVPVPHPGEANLSLRTANNSTRSYPSSGPDSTNAKPGTGVRFTRYAGAPPSPFLPGTDWMVSG